MSQDNEKFEMPKPRESSLRLAEALQQLLTSKAELDQAIADIPSYTGQYNDDHFSRHEQKAYNEACDAYESAVVNSVMSSSH
ncbi:hypothetical protein YA0089_28375 [Pseudomonas viridiflava]|uniref:hypothetical protein n=1 Tax=Pseudomonas viridiflava TaxID=33069 RepID=UPI0018E5AC23|nr:hypothetical protein [Pseudomonas viridiflava]MBI6727535.1 hypothetical protein [Pseudomonas viridiflava]